VEFTVHQLDTMQGGTVEVCSGVRTSDDHDGGIALEEAIISNGRFQQMTILF
jgi:hypothetical protein